MDINAAVGGKAGLSQETIEAALGIKESSTLPERERIALEYADRVSATPVPVKNSIRPAVIELERRGMLAARVGPEPSSLTTGSRDDPRPRCLGLPPRPPRQLSRCLTGECGPPASTVCA